MSGSHMEGGDKNRRTFNGTRRGCKWGTRVHGVYGDGVVCMVMMVSVYGDDGECVW